MEYFALPVLFGLVFLFEYLMPKWEKEGQFLKQETKRYYNKIIYYLEPYLNTEFGKKLNRTAIDLLNYTYKWNKKIVNPREDDIYIKIITNHNNNDYVYAFAWLFLYSHIGDIVNKESVMFPLATKIKRIVYEEKNTLPQELIDFFDIQLN